MSEAAVDRAGRWLHGQLEQLASSYGAREMLDRALDGVDALEVAGAIDAGSAASWRDELARAAAGHIAQLGVSEDAREAAGRLLSELLVAVPADPEWDDAEVERFEGALELLGEIRAVDPAEWDAEFRRRTNQPTAEEEEREIRRLNAGGTRVDLLEVVGGPPERRAGHRLIVALRFADGIAFLIDKDRAPEFEWPKWRLSDDLGTDYVRSGLGGSEEEEFASFSTAVPGEARQLRLVHERDPEIAFEVEL